MTEEEIRQFFKTKRKERGWSQHDALKKLNEKGVLIHKRRLPYDEAKGLQSYYHKIGLLERGKTAFFLKELVAYAEVFDHEVIIRPKPKLSTIEGAERMMNFMLGAKNELGQDR